MVCKSEPLFTTRRTKCTPLQRVCTWSVEGGGYMWRALETCVLKPQKTAHFVLGNLCFNENVTIWSISLRFTMCKCQARQQQVSICIILAVGTLLENTPKFWKNTVVLHTTAKTKQSFSNSKPLPSTCIYVYVCRTCIIHITTRMKKTPNNLGSHTASPPLYLQNCHLVDGTIYFGTRKLESHMGHMCSEMILNDSPTKTCYT